MPHRENPEERYGAPVTTRELTLFVKHLLDNNHKISIPAFNLTHFPASYPVERMRREEFANGLSQYEAASIAADYVRRGFLKAHKSKLEDEPIVFTTTDAGKRHISDLYSDILKGLERKKK